MSKEFKENFKQNVRIIILSIIIGLSFSYVDAVWSPPSNSPQSGWNTDAPINQSGTYQAKGVGGIIGAPSLRATNLLIGGYPSGGIPSTIANSSAVKIATDGSVAAEAYCNAAGTDCKTYTQLTSGGIPTGAVMAFNYGSCDEVPGGGWSLADGLSGRPDLRGRNIIGIGRATNANGTVIANSSVIAFGQRGGELKHDLILTEIPAHTHTEGKAVSQNTRAQNGSDGKTLYGPGSGSTGSAGGGAPHNVLDPYFALVYCVKD